MKDILIIFSILMLFAVNANSQKHPFRVTDDEMILRLDRRADRKETEELLKQFDMQLLPVDSAFNYGSTGRLAVDGWKVRRKNKNIIEVYKKTTGENKIDIIGIPFFVPEDFEIEVNGSLAENDYNNRVFGYNSFKKFSVIELNDSITQFRCYVKNKTQKVYLSGSFNDWSTQSLPMENIDGVWMANVKLRPGRHEYKFIIDGRWQNDGENKLKIDDNAGGQNSVYFKPNKQFKLDNFPDAKRVILSGSFNGWNEKEIEFRNENGRWICDVFLPDGMYYYKFIVDGQWITDPNNKNIVDDGLGNKYSFLSFGTPTKITLQGFENAKTVILSGSFNNWSESGATLKKTSTGWEIDYVLLPGNYFYKFIVDGRWIHDPNMTVVDNELGGKNNLLVIEPNHTFVLKGYENAKSVYVSGTFNSWGEPGYSMQKTEAGWMISLHLNRGKTLYKFVVDGKWILDPNNNLWEDNLLGTGNSVLWIDSESPGN